MPSTWFGIVSHERVHSLSWYLEKLADSKEGSAIS